MTSQAGHWIWYELLASDPDAAQAFYEKVVGWSVAQFTFDQDEGTRDYRVLSGADGEGAGGLMTLPEGAPMPPCWLGYLGAEDVDAKVAAIEAAGGKVLMPAMTIEGVGRLALVTDPQGVAFYVMRGAMEGPSKAYARREIGHAAWCELISPDDAGALAFYEAEFGIEKNGAMPMGEMGDYSFLQSPGAGESFGAVMRQQPNQPVAAWNFYFRVPDVAVAADAVRDGGGQVIMGPMEVPGGEHIIVAIDPQGAAFGLVSGTSTL